jgi:hypothetical protein
MEPSASPSAPPSGPQAAPSRQGRRVVISFIAFLTLVVVASGVVVALVSLARLLDGAI